MQAKPGGGKGGNPGSVGNTILGVPLYAVAAAVLVVVAVLVLLLSGSSNGFQSCSGKLLPQAKYSCYEYYANSTGNASICSNLNGLGAQYSDQCFYAVALAHSNASACSSISSQYLASRCVSNVSVSSGNALDCTPLPEPDKSACSYAVAKSLGFPSLEACNGIANASVSLTCESMYYYNAALATANLSYCSRIPEQPDSAALNAMMSTSSSDQENMALYNYYNITPRGYCYSKVAYITGDRQACSSLQTADASLCLSAFAASNYSSMNLSTLKGYCSNASSYPEVQEACVDSVTLYGAVSTKNVTACLEMNQTGLQYTCVVDIATRYNDASYCSYLNGTSAQSSCQMSVQNQGG